MLNCLTSHYSDLWWVCWDDEFTTLTWSKSDSRLSPVKYTQLTNQWNRESAFRTDFERRQALIEIDVITAMALGMSLEQLVAIYHSQFPVLLGNEKDTWYDANGRIVFSGRSMGKSLSTT